MRLNLGCGKDIREGYVNLDINPLLSGASYCDVTSLSNYKDGEVEEILALDIIEHFPKVKINPILKEWCRVLCPGGKLTIRTPDVDRIFELYQEAKVGEITWERLSEIIHGKQDGPFNFHFVSLSFPWIKSILKKHGMRKLSKSSMENQNMEIISYKEEEKAEDEK